MPHPVLVTTWPGKAELVAWLGPNAVSAVTDATLLQDCVDDASAKVYERIDTAKLPVDPDECPKTVARAIILEAARLLYRRESPHGAAAFGEIAIRLRTVDVDVDALLVRWRMDPLP